ncbi:zinc finger MYM-type protein 1-like isoform X1 [Phyllobates terribilis]|uniref:zinc finger MYM-type protein 1-like isoform X1 n=1 Tax=Phyllobates terribilis TaxID=111132 RepID=UPI003CCA9E65
MEAGTSIEILRKDYSDDPSTWTVINDDLRLDVVKLGPTQVKDLDFPLDTNRRKFSCVHYKRRLVNGESLERNWLTYSIHKNSVFCFCCTLFPDSSLQLGIIKRSALGTDGVNDWKNISAILASHEKSKDHMISFQKWKELENRPKMNKTIDEEHLRKIEEQEKYWHQILERLIALVRVLGTQNLAFRGSNNGNFLKFVEYLAVFDPVMCEHIRKIRDKEIHAHYLGKTIQNEMIQLLSNGIQVKILDDVKTAKYFSIVLDCTSDVSHVEQMTIIVRFVSTSEDKKFEIKEHFLGFIPVSDTTGGGLTAAVLNKFEELSLSVDNLRGQGYDNGSNMKGKNIGLQR